MEEGGYILTLQAAYLLHLLKWAQQVEDDSCGISKTNMVVGRLMDGGVKKRDKIKKIRFLRHSIDSVVKFLEENEYIIVGHDFIQSPVGGRLYVCQVKHKAWHLSQFLFHEFCRSILLPIFVSAITAILVHILIPSS